MLQHAVISRGVLQHALWPRQGDNNPLWVPSAEQWQVERNRALAAEREYSALYMSARDALEMLRGGADALAERALVDAGVEVRSALGDMDV